MKSRIYEKVLYRLRLGRVGVRKYFYRVGLANNAICEYCDDQIEETINHFLFDCEGFRIQRNQMLCNLRKLNINDVTLKVVLGRDQRYSGITMNIFAVLIKYMIETNRLKNI